MFHQFMHWVAVVAIYAALLAASIYEGKNLADHFLSQKNTALSNPNNETANIIPAAHTSSFSRSLFLFVGLLALAVSSLIFREFVWNHPGVILVLLGVVGENVWDEKLTEGIQAMYRFSANILILGLVVEMFEAVQMDAKLTQTKREAGEANAQAGLANERAAHLEKETAVAKKELEQERIRRLELEASLAPRVLPLRGYTDGTQNIDELKPFAGTKVILKHIQDAEAALAAGNIRFLLEEAGWKIASFGPTTEHAFNGVNVHRYMPPINKFPTSEERAIEGMAAMKPAVALADFLEDNGWVANGSTDGIELTSKDEVKVVVGFKPSPYFESPAFMDARKARREARQREKPQKPVAFELLK